ncbi:arylamine N-acetyltransferase 2 [Phaeosphaeria sp. MPI-PUGE-AT-0046c]|nr:arylamine N-acetyltransferase 2 [Phaeosphaeria sp. MPI-PUGE-AT-0046c]
MTIASVFTDSHVSSFLTYVGLLPSLQSYRFTGNVTKDLHFLTQLHIHTISTIPYENLWLHYNPTHINTIAPLDIYNSTVSRNQGRGGYCFQVSIFFNHMLRALGFAAYLVPVRIRMRVNGVPYGDYGGWRHLVNIVPLSDGTKWSLDVGFGGDGPTAPLQLTHDSPSTNLGAQQVRLVRDWIPTQLHRTEASKLWVYEYRNGPEKAWNAFYAFGDVEAMEGDFDHLNWYTGFHPESFQTYRCIIVKFLRRPRSDESEDQEIYGKRMLINGVVKENLGGRTSVVEDCRTEEQRIAALEKWFGIILTEEEREGIRGWGTELTGDGSEGVEARTGKEEETWMFTRGEGSGRRWIAPA